MSARRLNERTAALDGIVLDVIALAVYTLRRDGPDGYAPHIEGAKVA